MPLSFTRKSEPQRVYSHSIHDLVAQAVSGDEGNVDYRVSVAYGDTDSFFDANGDRIPPAPNAQGGFADATTFNVLSKVGVDITEAQLFTRCFAITEPRFVSQCC